MADWYGNRYSETYTYTRVTWDGWNEYENYGYVTDGSLEFSSDSSLKVTGSFNFEGLEVPRTDDLVRVYYSFRDSYGESVSVPLATLFVNYSSLSYTDTTSGMKSKGTLNGQSVLVVLQEDIYGPPMTIPRGTNPILEAVRIIKECGLNVDYIPTSMVLTVDYTFNAGTSYLEIINWLCEFAGYNEPFPDGYGTILLTPMDNNYDPVLTFANDDKSIMYPEVSDETNLSTAHNVVKIGYSSSSMYLYAVAKNMSGSPISLDQTGGRQSVLYEDASDVDERTNPANTIKNLAEERLQEEAIKTETVTFSHAYIPFNINDAIEIVYSSYDWVGYVENISISLKPSTKTQTKIQRSEAYDIYMTTDVHSTRGDDNE